MFTTTTGSPRKRRFWRWGTRRKSLGFDPQKVSPLTEQSLYEEAFHMYLMDDRQFYNYAMRVCGSTK